MVKPQNMSVQAARNPLASCSIENRVTSGPEAIVLGMNMAMLCELLQQLGQPSSQAHAAILRQRVETGESVDQILESFEHAAFQGARRAA